MSNYRSRRLVQPDHEICQFHHEIREVVRGEILRAGKPGELKRRRLVIKTIKITEDYHRAQELTRFCYEKNAFAASRNWTVGLGKVIFNYHDGNECFPKTSIQFGNNAFIASHFCNFHLVRPSHKFSLTLILKCRDSRHLF